MIDAKVFYDTLNHRRPFIILIKYAFQKPEPHSLLQLKCLQSRTFKVGRNDLKSILVKFRPGKVTLWKKQKKLLKHYLLHESASGL